MARQTALFNRAKASPSRLTGEFKKKHRHSPEFYDNLPCARCGDSTASQSPAPAIKEINRQAKQDVGLRVQKSTWNLISIIVNHLNRNLPRLRPLERPANRRIQTSPRGFIHFRFQSLSQPPIRLIRPREIDMPHKKTLPLYNLVSINQQAT
jgi:hypothetical protein